MAINSSKCSNCGASLDNTARLRCPYCGERLLDSQKEHKEIKYKYIKADKIHTNSYTQEAAEDSLIRRMVYDESPIDVFDSLKITSEKVYIPFWIFYGSIETNWQCIQVIERPLPWYTGDWVQSGSLAIDVYRINAWKAVNPPQYIPRQGMARDSFQVVVSASHVNDTINCSDYNSFDIGLSDYFSSMIENDAYVYPIDSEKADAWQLVCDKKLNSRLNIKTNEAITEQLPECYRDLTCSVQYSYSKCIGVLCECWELTFEYKNNIYISLVTGGFGNSHYRFPQKEETDEKANSDLNVSNATRIKSKDQTNLVKIKPRINLTLFGWGCFILFCIGCITTLWAFIENYNNIAIISLIYAILSALFGTIMNLKQLKEEELIKDVQELNKKNLYKKYDTEPLHQNIEKLNDKIRQRNDWLNKVLATNYFSDSRKEKLIHSLREGIKRHDKDTQKKIDSFRREITNLKKKKQKQKEKQKELENRINSYHKKLSADKRARFFYGVILTIALFLTILSGVIAVTERQNQRAEMERMLQEELLQKQQEEERFKNEIEQKRNEQKQREKMVLDFISPKNLLNVDKNGCYQLREDFAQALQKAGFEKKEKGSYIGNTISYIFYVDNISDDGSISKRDYLTVDIEDIQYKSIKNIYERHQYITFKGEFDLDYLNRLEHQLKQQGFEVRKQGGDYPEYDCTKETTLDNEIDKNTYMKNKVSIVLKSYEIKFVISQGPYIRHKDP